MFKIKLSSLKVRNKYHPKILFWKNKWVILQFIANYTFNSFNPIFPVLPNFLNFVLLKFIEWRKYIIAKKKHTYTHHSKGIKIRVSILSIPENKKLPVWLVFISNWLLLIIFLYKEMKIKLTTNLTQNIESSANGKKKKKDPFVT